MNPILNFITSEIIKRKKMSRIKNESINRQKIEKNLSIDFNHFIKDSFYIILGAFSAALGLRGFLLPNHFIDGGVTGISMIASELTGVSLAVLLVLINIPFMILAFSTITRQFFFKSIFAIFFLAASVHLIHMPAITDDKLLVSVFGGFFLGLGIGLAIRGGSVIDGTEVLAVFVSRKLPLTIGDVILIFNIFIFFVAFYVFDIETSLYAMLTYLSASKTVDFVVSGIEEYVGVTIISEKSDEMRLTIIEKLGRACTIYKGKKGYARKGDPLKPVDIVYTVLTRLELSKLQAETEKIDEDAFFIMHTIKDVKGGMIKKRPMK